jgi:death-on-curing protein
VTEPVWVRDDVVLAIHQRQIAEHGGAVGLRDEGLLAMATSALLSWPAAPSCF